VIGDWTSDEGRPFQRNIEYIYRSEKFWKMRNIGLFWCLLNPYIPAHYSLIYTLYKIRYTVEEMLPFKDVFLLSLHHSLIHTLTHSSSLTCCLFNLCSSSLSVNKLQCQSSVTTFIGLVTILYHEFTHSHSHSLTHTHTHTLTYCQHVNRQETH
jgi:hypothetical protein